ncbi:hypothetical protein [Oceanobacillus luteolus]|uniref:Lipoprotein n=1 Tax=Oceanobacillus luteolus TaxID=1274358 RepID=A0ABW4HNE6_9BACI
MKIKHVLTGVLSVGIALTLAACSGEAEDQEDMMETPPAESETTPSTGETDPGTDTEMEEEEPATGSEPGSEPGDAEDPNAETEDELETEEPTDSEE